MREAILGLGVSRHRIAGLKGWMLAKLLTIKLLPFGPDFNMPHYGDQPKPLAAFRVDFSKYRGPEMLITSRIPC